MRHVAASRGSASTPAPFIFQQDSAPAHRAKKTMAYLEEEGICFWKPGQWPPNSPDLNPMDYAIWSMVVQGAGEGRPSSVTAMKRKINASWRSMDPDKIRSACRSFRPRLSRCVEKKAPFLTRKWPKFKPKYEIKNNRTPVRIHQKIFRLVWFVFH